MFIGPRQSAPVKYDPAGAETVPSVSPLNNAETFAATEI